jgi:cytochrome subunit of sulfide dehydrogenase
MRVMPSGSWVFAVVLGLALAASAPAAADFEPLIGAECAPCHGEMAPSPFPNVPTIHGQPESVLSNALYDFRATIRPCRKVECGAEECPDIDFCATMAGLSDEQIDAMARWYAAREFVPAGEPWDPAHAKWGAVLHAHCESCHAGGGADSVAGASILRGQRKAYLRSAIADVREDRRVALAEMHAILLELSDEEIAALVEYYASPVDRLNRKEP